VSPALGKQLEIACADAVHRRVGAERLPDRWRNGETTEHVGPSESGPAFEPFRSASQIDRR